MVLVASWLDVMMADLEEILSRSAWVLDSRVFATLMVSLVMVWRCPWEVCERSSKNCRIGTCGCSAWDMSRM